MQIFQFFYNQIFQFYDLKIVKISLTHKQIILVIIFKKNYFYCKNLNTFISY